MRVQVMKMRSGRKRQSMEQAKKLLSHKGSYFLPFMTKGGVETVLISKKMSAFGTNDPNHDLLTPCQNTIKQIYE